MPAPKRSPEITLELRTRATRMVYEEAERFKVPPVDVTAHVCGVSAGKARREVMRRMITELGMARHQVAKAFGRDVRRVRKSVLGV